MLSFIGLGSFGSQHYTNVAIIFAVDRVCWSGEGGKRAMKGKSGIMYLMGMAI